MPKSDNTAREQRILDAAAHLISHYGYDKTAVSDIAREAGVSQGAIYLHFASKDELFESLFLREMQTYAENWLARVEADPNGGTMGGIYKNMLYALSSSAFMAAMFKQDRRVFGSYLRRPDNFFRRTQGGGNPSPRYTFIRLMQDAGAVRKDVAPAVVAHIMNMLAYGLVAMEDIMDEADIPPLDDLINGIADLMDRALAPAQGSDSEAGKAIVRQLFEQARQQIEQMAQEGQEPS